MKDEEEKKGGGVVPSVFIPYSLYWPSMFLVCSSWKQSVMTVVGTDIKNGLILCNFGFHKATSPLEDW